MECETGALERTPYGKITNSSFTLLCFLRRPGGAVHIRTDKYTDAYCKTYLCSVYHFLRSYCSREAELDPNLPPERSIFNSVYTLLHIIYIPFHFQYEDVTVKLKKVKERPILHSILNRFLDKPGLEYKQW